MSNPFSVEDKSITTAGTQALFMDGNDAAKLKGKRVLVVDDVISTGGSISAVEKLVEKAGGTVVGRVAILAEGNAAKRDDIIVLGALPLFDAQGNPLPL
jgi:adenine phosphoribosyltransferase